MPAAQPAQENPPAARKWWVLFAVGLGTFMSALDGSVVNAVLPVIRRSFGDDVAAVEWVVVVYLLVISGLLLSFGRLGDLQGHRRVYLSGFLIFILGSILCGLAPTTFFLIAARAFQALGAAMLSANSPAILTKSFPSSERGQALGLQATMTYLGLTVGPSLGGWLTDLLGWRSVFYINLPVGLLALLAGMRFIPRDAPEGRTPPFDLRGALAFSAGLVSLLLALNQGHDWGWASPRTLGLIAAALIILGGFVYLERRAASPMLDLSLFASRIFSASVVSAIFNYICVYSIMFLMPFYLQDARGLSASAAGLILTAMPITMSLVAPVSGTLSDRVGPTWPGILGMLILGGGLLMLARLNMERPVVYAALPLAICGLGIGMFIAPNNSALMGSAPRNRQGIAAGIMATARNVGMVLGVGIAGAVFNTQLTAQAAHLAAGYLFAARAGFLAASIFAFLGALTSAIRSRPDPSPT